ncbi:hypothetical protein FHS79_003539 [Polymorphobacter multimanifer]|uniref:Uncharacterized protein n=1 Tax=Polymorphobacter multimanifer TaxID=1070431 RepID=A0A841LK44_9SPHN|nr:hypothetical protein [Polymorphobacter multimanifer]MBB6229338.1 hypothetical protein [Polymorphobacter multimanifer]
MSSKRTGRALADVMGELDEEPTVTPTAAAVDISVAKESGTPAIVPINVQVTPRDRKRLRQLSLDSGLSLQKLGHEAWNRLLEARGLEPLEAVAASVPSGRSRR